MRRIVLTGLLWAAVTLAMSAAIVFIVAKPAKSDERQDYIHRFHKDCCPHNHCFPVTATPSLHFWNVEGYHSLVPLGGERRWHFKETYGCAYPHSPKVIRCLFRAPPEAS